MHKSTAISEKKTNWSRAIFISLLFLGVLAGAVAAFLMSYSKLKNTMALEREEYLSELTTQIAHKVNGTILRKQEGTSYCIELLKQLKPDSYQKLEGIYQDVIRGTMNEKILLVSDKGIAYQLDGNSIRVANSDFITGLLRSPDGEEAQNTAFSQLGNIGDFWLFGKRMPPITIGGHSIVALIRASSCASLSEDMTVAMFSKQTYSFLIADGGEILVRPTNAAGYGSNLINSLVKKGMPESERERLLADIADDGLTSFFFEMGGAPWLLQSTVVQTGYSVALLMSLDITAMDTMEAMNRTMLTVGVFVVIVVALAFAVALMFWRIRNERLRQEALYREKLAVQTAQSKSDFLTKMSHDIRTPLNGIIGMAYLARDNIDDRAALADNLSKMQSSADYLLSLINDLLDMSKLENGKMKLSAEIGNIEDAVLFAKNQFADQAMEKRIRLLLHRPDKIPCGYRFDALRIKQILMNLLSNAMKFTGRGGQVTLSLEIEPLDERRDNIILAVADSGVGMGEEYMSRIFTPFEQESEQVAARQGGTGLGLSIVKSLTDLMQGTVRVKSECDRGSTFTVTLPLERAGKQRTAARTKARDSAAPFAGKRVLLAEDNAINATIAKQIVSKWGLSVTHVENGKLALEKFIGSPAGCYAVILMDVMMPIMDGCEAARAIRSSGHPDAQTIPIYAMSANAYAEDVEKALASGMNGHLKKPIEVDVVEETIANSIQWEGEK